MSIFDVWFLWPISLSAAATVACLSLHLAATRTGKPASIRRLLVGGGLMSFVLPAVASRALIRTSCNPDTGMGLGVRAPWVFLLALAVAGIGAFRWLRVVSGPPQSRWRLPAILVGIGVVGLVVESVVGLVALEGLRVLRARLPDPAGRLGAAHPNGRCAVGVEYSPTGRRPASGN